LSARGYLYKISSTVYKYNYNDLIKSSIVSNGSSAMGYFLSESYTYKEYNIGTIDFYSTHTYGLTLFKIDPLVFSQPVWAMKSSSSFN
jgi:hypothetical protein